MPPPTSPDPILGLMMDARADPRTQKVDLTAGVYKDEKMSPFVLTSVKAVIEEAIQQKNVNIFRPLPPCGDLETADQLLNLCFGSENVRFHAERFSGKVARIHCQSGGNGLFFIFELLKKFYPNIVDQRVVPEKQRSQSQASVWCATDTWPIHFQMLERHSIHIKTHRYYNAEKNCFDFEGMVEDLEHMQEGDMLLLQPAGHNPTGYDPSKKQWQQLAELLKRKKVQTIFDFAYMGYSSGDIDEDSYAVRLFLDEGLDFFLTISCSKNFGLYSARVGCMAIYMQSIKQVKEMTSYLNEVAKVFYGAPDVWGAHIVREILSNAPKRTLWLKDLEIMTSRIKQCRLALKSELDKTDSTYKWDFIVQQFGMFAYTGLTAAQVKRLKDEFAIYMINTGRASITGLTVENAAYVAKAFDEVTKKQ
jgi:aspartate/tyrosine/aromatic aminotransferase